MKALEIAVVAEDLQAKIDALPEARLKTGQKQLQIVREVEEAIAGGASRSYAIYSVSCVHYVSERHVERLLQAYAQHQSGRCQNVRPAVG